MLKKLIRLSTSVPNVFFSPRIKTSVQQSNNFTKTLLTLSNSKMHTPSTLIASTISTSKNSHQPFHCTAENNLNGLLMVFFHFHCQEKTSLCFTENARTRGTSSPQKMWTRYETCYGCVTNVFCITLCSIFRSQFPQGNRVERFVLKNDNWKVLLQLW